MTDVVTRALEAPDFVKDQATGALINTNAKALETYRTRRKKNKEIEDLKEKVESMEQKLNLILSLLTENSR